MRDTAITLVFLSLPTLATAWAWKNRVNQATTWRESLSVLTLTVLTADLAYGALFLLWPFFGAQLGSGLSRWELTAKLVAAGFWVSVVALALGIICKAGKQKFVLLALSVAAIAFWLTMLIPVTDRYAIEGARQAASPSAQPR